jgi:hypothetical protein
MVIDNQTILLFSFRAHYKLFIRAAGLATTGADFYFR